MRIQYGLPLLILYTFLILDVYGQEKISTDHPSIEELGIKIPLSPSVLVDESIQDKVKIEISLRKEKASPCEPIVVSVTATNVSQEIVTTQDSYLYEDFILEVKNSKGELANLTDFGRRFYNKSSTFHRYIIFDMNPSDCRTTQLLVNRLYDMTLSEKYQIRVKSTFRQNQQEKHTCCEVWSNTVDIEICDQ